MDTDTQQNKPSELAQSLRTVVEDADAVLKNVMKSGDAQFDALRDRLASQVRQMRRQLDELEDTAAHKARQAVRATDAAVHAHPYTAIGVAAAVGAIIGLLFARRS